MLVDTNVLIDVLANDPQWADWSTRQMRMQAKLHRLHINPVIYAELALAFDSVEALDAALAGLGLQLREPPRAALFLAGKAFAQYRRDGGSKNTVLPDLFIGAHAAVKSWPVLTRDARRYVRHFPTVRVVGPAQ